MRNVLFVGNMAAGKSAIASVLAEQGYSRAAFADGVRTIAALAYGTLSKSSPYLVHDIKQGYMEVSGREILQKVGQQLKYVDQDFWLKIVEQTMARLGGFPWVIDDGRFDFELDWARKNGFLIVGVNTPLEIRMLRYESLYGRLPNYSELNHASEQGIPSLFPKCDMIVMGTDDPYNNVRRIQAWQTSTT